VYFFKGDMVNAAAQAKPIMQSGTYDLDVDVITKYSRATTTGGTTKEVIWAIPSVSATNNLWGGLPGHTEPITPVEQYLNFHHQRA
jgi:hypothetical protein